ncbi:Nucleoside diphosphate-linked moiety X motif 6 [Trichoplax sp. H2]|uniref:Nudix hydrolase domain-containing protein n=1 Tax=Trichoplax adhaerens TaxID=10228 RepID=B3RXU0_TRIAD|nr:hypothetical protein TRIADDRAFT_56328 [Trichoplax adhaerens]EDV24490.1 hypothetical protein TRIADDRAFT_56328 [Trichoplax adhaerens]RDD46766.1 Nucleoside diphosphate-linked moiety X motif 6 [Trichoplax sp. H2]|eukprot:XP_002112380.1 hypothetical protein TRIADDRAFT_56328 [Trichoplax adhaerens]
MISQLFTFSRLSLKEKLFGPHSYTKFYTPIVSKLRGLSTISLESLKYRFIWHGGVEIDLQRVDNHLLKPANFDSAIAEAVKECRNLGKRTVWLKVPIQSCNLIAVAAKHGFQFHHAKGDTAMMNCWLPDDIECKVPLFGTHKVGVCGVVVDESTKKVLAIQERIMKIRKWKFPGGHADHGEDFRETAIREVYEETGIQAELASDEDANPLTKCISRLILSGFEKGFDHIDITFDEMPSIYEGITYKLYHR